MTKYHHARQYILKQARAGSPLAKNCRASRPQARAGALDESVVWNVLASIINVKQSIKLV